MLKITTIKTDRRCRLVLEGKLIAPWVAEVDREWNDARVSTRDLSLTVDLRNVTMISEVGEDILLRMMHEGVRFICGGVLNRHVLQRLARKLRGKIPSLKTRGG
jgi:hypothetical protein